MWLTPCALLGGHWPKLLIKLCDISQTWLSLDLNIFCIALYFINFCFLKYVIAPFKEYIWISELGQTFRSQFVLYLTLWTGLAGATRLTQSGFMLYIGWIYFYQRGKYFVTYPIHGYSSFNLFLLLPCVKITFLSIIFKVFKEINFWYLIIFIIKFGDGDGQNLCRVKKK